MKSLRILSALGLVALTATSLANGPAVGAAEHSPAALNSTVMPAVASAALTLTSPVVGETLSDAIPTFSGTAAPGALVEVLDDAGHPIATPVVASPDGHWTASPTEAFAPGVHSGTVREDSGAGSVVAYVFSVSGDDESAAVEEPGIHAEELVIDTPKLGGFIFTDVEGGAIPVFAGSAVPGAELRVARADGVILGVTTASKDGSWSVPSRFALPIGWHYGAVAMFVGGVPVQYARFDFVIIDEHPVRPLVVNSPAIGGSIQADASGSATPVFTGTATPGADVRIEGSSGSLLGRTKADATTGAWSIVWNKSVLPARYVGGRTVQTVGGQDAPGVGYDFTVRLAAAERPLVVTSPTVGGDVLTGGAATVRPVFTGTATPGAEIRIVGASGSVVGTTRAHATTGAWTITWNKWVAPARYAGGKTIQSVGGKEIGSVGYDFTVKLAADVIPVVLTSPATGDEIVAESWGSARPVFTGTAMPGADVRVVTATGKNVGTTKADAVTGAWTITWTQTLRPATYRGGSVIQSIGGTDIGTTAPYDFTVIE